MKMKNIIIFVLIFIFTAGCVPSKKITSVTLDFTKWIPEEYGYKYRYIRIDALKGHKLKKVEYKYDGWFEYQFLYKDESVFFVSTNILEGSRLNSENLWDIGIKTLAISRSLEPVDTIKKEGVQKDGRYWSTYILGDVAVGYTNATKEKKEYFQQMLNSIQRLNYK